MQSFTEIALNWFRELTQQFKTQLMRKILIALVALAWLSPTLAFPQINVSYNITPQSGRSSISPYIYGFNWEQNANFTTGQNFRFVRMGGNRATTYNWENNASNAGSDYQYLSDDFWSWYLGITQSEVPGIAATTIVDQAINNNAEALITLQMAGYVSADKNGALTSTAPHPRWAEVVPAKGSAFTLTPNLNDGKVYMDEFVNFLKSRYGSGRVKYSLDNEPDLWSHTHPYVHPNAVTCQELIDRTTVMSTAVKAADANAEIFGFVSYGFNGFVSLQNAPDWNSVKGSYSWFVDYFLDKMRVASNTAGKRLVDVLDLHWYPEAIGDQRIINSGANSTNDKLARLQAPRALWDPNYTENSWIYQSFSSFMPLIPKVKASIDAYNPGTKIAFTEFQYGGYEDITGAIALADVLGIFGKYGVHAATHWSVPGTYGSLAYKIFNNYDGNSAMYGDVNVGATMSDRINSSVYASVTSSSDNELHVIVLNKSMTSSINGTFTINGSNLNYTTATVYAVQNGSPSVSRKTDMTISGNAFNYSLPALSVYHFILKSGTSVPVAGVTVSPATATINAGESVQLTASVTPSNATNKNVTWSSSNSSIASVSSAGLVTAMSAGSATVTATTVDGNKTATCSVTVTNINIPVSGITVSPTTASVQVGGTAQLTATIQPTNATNKNVSWSSANTAIATVSSTGLVTGITAGSTTVTVTSVSGGFQAVATITVTQPSFCSNPVTVTLPFAKDGAGEFCYVTSQPMAYVNSWNMQLLEINGVNYTNRWSNSLPAAQNGMWYIRYIGTFPWSHFEAAPGSQNARLAVEHESIEEAHGLLVFPNPVKDRLHIVFPEKLTNRECLTLYDLNGRTIESLDVSGESCDLDVSKFVKGTYSAVVRTVGKVYKGKFIKE